MSYLRTIYNPDYKKDGDFEVIDPARIEQAKIVLAGGNRVLDLHLRKLRGTLKGAQTGFQVQGPDDITSLLSLTRDQNPEGLVGHIVGAVSTRDQPAVVVGIQYTVYPS